MLTVFAGRSFIELPVRPPRPEDAQLRTFGQPFVPETTGATVVEPDAPVPPKVFEWNVATRTLRASSKVRGQGGRRRLNETGTELYSSGGDVLEIRDDDPTSAKMEFHLMQGFKREDWDARVEAALRISVTRSDFLLTGEIKAFDSGREVFSKQWDRKIPRKFI